MEARPAEALLCAREHSAGVRLDRDARSRTDAHVVPSEPERCSVVTLHVASRRIENDRRLAVEPDLNIVVVRNGACRVRLQRRSGEQPPQFGAVRRVPRLDAWRLREDQARSRNEESDDGGDDDTYQQGLPPGGLRRRPEVVTGPVARQTSTRCGQASACSLLAQVSYSAGDPLSCRAPVCLAMAGYPREDDGSIGDRAGTTVKSSTGRNSRAPNGDSVAHGSTATKATARIRTCARPA